MASTVPTLPIRGDGSSPTLPPAVLWCRRCPPPSPPRRANSKSLIKPLHPNRLAVHVAAEATSSTPAGSRQKMPSDHDPIQPISGSFVLLSCTRSSHATDPLGRPTPSCPSLRSITAQPTFFAKPASRENPQSSTIPPHSRPDLDPSRPTAKLKIPYQAQPPRAPHPRQSNRVSAAASAAETLNSFRTRRQRGARYRKIY